MIEDCGTGYAVDKKQTNDIKAEAFEPAPPSSPEEEQAHRKLYSIKDVLQQMVAHKRRANWNYRLPFPRRSKCRRPAHHWGGGIGIGLTPIARACGGGIGIGLTPIPATPFRTVTLLNTTNNAKSNASLLFFTGSPLLLRPLRRSARHPSSSEEGIFLAS